MSRIIASGAARRDETPEVWSFVGDKGTVNGLLYKPDWQEVKQRYTAWWNREKMDRCLAQVRAPRDNAPDEDPPQRPETPEAMWTDLDLR